MQASLLLEVLNEKLPDKFNSIAKANAEITTIEGLANDFLKIIFFEKCC